MDPAAAYIPIDRRWAMAEGRALPDRDQGAVLFVDISGFSRLTNDLMARLGERRGLGELTRYLNEVYDALIAEVHRYGGSVIGFSGDSILCWFSQRCGPMQSAESDLRQDGLRAVACALAMQQVMSRFIDIQLWSGVTMSIRVKVIVSVGRGRRFVVGDPTIQYLDMVAGEVADRLRAAAAEVQQGEVMLVPAAVEVLNDCVEIVGLRLPANSHQYFALIAGLTCVVEPTPWPASAFPGPTTEESVPLSEAAIRCWFLPPVYERLKSGQDQFLAEFRRTMALFVNFTGIDFDEDDEAGLKVDAYLRRVQQILARYGGFLIQLSTGEKGVYLYASFGAPLAHDDDPQRALAAAIEIRGITPSMPFLTGVRLALSRGQMRAGAVGSAGRRTYGVLGDEVNLASRLMDRAAWGEIFLSKHAFEVLANDHQYEQLEPVMVKGWTAPVPVFALRDLSTARPGPVDDLYPPLLFDPLFQAVQAGRGQIFRLESMPGLGKNQLVSALIQSARQKGFLAALSSCRHDELTVAYHPWSQIFRFLFGLSDKSVDDAFLATARDDLTQLQITRLETVVRETNTEWSRLLPLLGDLLDLPISDNDITSIFEPALLRQGALFALVLEMLQTWAKEQPMLLLIDEAHGMDQASFRLMSALAQMLASMPVLLVLVIPPLSEEAEWWPEAERLPNYNHLSLDGRLSLGAARQSVDQDHRPEADNLVSVGRSVGVGLIGRQRERAWLDERLNALVKTGEGGSIIIEGEAGIGKSRLVREVSRTLPGLGVMNLIGSGNAIERSTPYHAWRQVFQQFFSLDAQLEDPVARSTYVLAQLPASSETDLLKLAPLLNAVLPLDLPDNEITREITGEGRADNTRDMLASLLQLAAKRSPLVLILEDAQWLDSASWALAQQVCQQVKPLLLLLVLRPMPAPLPAEYDYFMTAPATRRLRLDGLALDETLALVCDRLGVKSLPARIAQLVRDKAEGHPFYSEELAYALRDAGHIRIENGECYLASHVTDINAINIPDTIEGVVTSRIDRLTAQQQLALKIASVIGRNFTFATLHDIYPIPGQRSQLADILIQLQALDITLVETQEPDLRYVFKHGITQEVVYNLMIFEQRQQLHRSVAEWYEQKYSGESETPYPLLAHHWSHSGDTVRATNYLERAGEQALRNGVYQEGVNFFQNALSLAEANEAGIAPIRRARWGRYLGQAYYGLGRLAESRAAFDRALEILGWPVLTSRKQATIGAAQQVLRQIKHRVSLSRLRQRLPWASGVQSEQNLSRTREKMLEASIIYERLGLVYYHANLTSLIFNAVLRSLNLAEQAGGATPELARAYAIMSIATGIVPIHPLARSYSRRAREIARTLDQSVLQADILIRTSLYDAACGNWTEAVNALERALDIARRFSAWSSLGEGLLIKALVEYGRGAFDLSRDHVAELHALGERLGNVQYQAWGLNGLAFHQWQAGEAEQALETLEQALPLLETDFDFVTRIFTYEILALAQARLGNSPQARQANKAASRLIAQAPPNPLSAFFDYVFVALVYVDLWEMNQDRPPLVQEVFARLAQQACQSLRYYGWLLPVGQPRVWLTLGRNYWLSGKASQARQAWAKSLEISRRLAMPYEQGLAHYEIGRHLPSTDQARQTHLTEARTIFQRLDAPYDLAQVEQALST